MHTIFEIIAFACVSSCSLTQQIVAVHSQPGARTSPTMSSSDDKPLMKKPAAAKTLMSKLTEWGQDGEDYCMPACGYMC